MSIRGVPVRATINIGNGSVIIRTPFILSFSVNKQRGAPATFNASIKVSHDDIKGAVAGGPIFIEAGTKGNEKRIFTGMVKTATISPCFDDPNFVNMTLQGGDILTMLEGKKYTRRCRATKGNFATIQGVVRQGLKSKRFAYSDEAQSLTIDSGDLDAEAKVTRATSNADIGKIVSAEPVKQDEPGQVNFAFDIAAGS